MAAEAAAAAAEADARAEAADHAHLDRVLRAVIATMTS